MVCKEACAATMARAGCHIRPQVRFAFGNRFHLMKHRALVALYIYRHGQLDQSVYHTVSFVESKATDGPVDSIGTE